MKICLLAYSMDINPAAQEKLILARRLFEKCTTRTLRTQGVLFKKQHRQNQF